MATNPDCNIKFPLKSEEKSNSVYDDNGLYIMSISNQDHKNKIIERVNSYDELINKHNMLLESNGVDLNLFEEINKLTLYLKNRSESYNSASKQNLADYTIGFDKGVSFAYNSISISISKILDKLKKLI